MFYLILVCDFDLLFWVCLIGVFVVCIWCDFVCFVWSGDVLFADWFECCSGSGLIGAWLSYTCVCVCLF